MLKEHVLVVLLTISSAQFSEVAADDNSEGPLKDASATSEGAMAEGDEKYATNELPVTKHETTGTEARCAELGVNCVCAEPFNTGASGVGYDWNPPDSTIKECSMWASGIWPTFREANDLFTDNDPTVLGSLPDGHQVDYYLRAPDSYEGSWDTGGWLNSAFTKRAAFRFYIYHSPDFRFTQTGLDGCGNKFIQFHSAARAHGQGDPGYFMIEHPSGNLGWMYAFNGGDGWSCASDDPPCPMPIHGVPEVPTPGPVMTAQKWKGKWWRVEVIFRNLAGGPSGSGYDMKLYMKNVTDQTQEEMYMDWEVGSANWTPHPALVPESPIDLFMINLYRQLKDDCSGWRGISHMMIAGWDTDEGQRIGSAYEIESSHIFTDGFETGDISRWSRGFQEHSDHLKDSV